MRDKKIKFSHKMLQSLQRKIEITEFSNLLELLDYNVVQITEADLSQSFRKISQILQ